ncbi:MAG: hypothetical protein FWC36_01200 [Spirochaetes bacterium]|nr:hypothetical protein [Spirochaetota bacterium]
MSDKSWIKYPGEVNKNNNLYEKMQLLLQQYQDFIARKERLESRALGYLTPLSILLAVTIIIAILVVRGESKDMFFFLFLLLFFGQIYYFILTLIFTLKAYSAKRSLYPDIKNYFEKKQTTDACFLERINTVFVETIDDLGIIIKQIARNVEYCRIWFGFSIFFAISNIALFAAHMLLGYLGK